MFTYTVILQAVFFPQFFLEIIGIETGHTGSMAQSLCSQFLHIDIGFDDDSEITEKTVKLSNAVGQVIIKEKPTSFLLDDRNRKIISQVLLDSDGT